MTQARSRRSVQNIHTSVTQGKTLLTCTVQMKHSDCPCCRGAASSVFKSQEAKTVSVSVAEEEKNLFPAFSVKVRDCPPVTVSKGGTVLVSPLQRKAHLL